MENDLRKKIDEIDDQIIPLLEKRCEAVSLLAKYKKDLTDSEREEKILSKIRNGHLRQIYKAIFSQSKKIVLAKKEK